MTVDDLAHCPLNSSLLISEKPVYQCIGEKRVSRMNEYKLKIKIAVCCHNINECGKLSMDPIFLSANAGLASYTLT